MSNKDYWFISHCSKDIRIVEQIVNILEQCGIAYWKAPEMIPAGSNYAREIPKALKECSVFLFVVSEASQSSIWVEKEVDIAINCGKKIIPVRIDNLPLNDMYRFYLNNVQMIDAYVEPDGQIPEYVQKKLHSRFMENTNKNDVWIKNDIWTKNDVDLKNEQTIKIDDYKADDYKIDTRSNALRINKIPMQCDKCGRALENIELGVYRCKICGIEYYDDFRKIRNFLKENGPAPAIIISKRTGVSRKTVECYFSDDLSVHYSGMDYSKTRLSKQSNKGTWHSDYGKNYLGNRRR